MQRERRSVIDLTLLVDILTEIGKVERRKGKEIIAKALLD